eukprot:TRINITY_DN38454_c0_g1_i1.p1 TRINITY_DN38454_c0_g1~~TRINITY_DN38454_c0_g1_i1.p1  ORF type:complete len:570 (+),score=93.59 TRINITY_DN38454_c0_g1_i1:46-1755(+)
MAKVAEADRPHAGPSRMKPRRTTDIVWAVIFIAAVGFYFYIMSYAKSNGKPEKFEQLYNSGSQAVQLSQSQTQEYQDQFTKLVATVMDVLSQWQLLLGAALLAGVIGAVLLLVVKKFAGVIIRLCLAILVLCPITAGLYLIYVSGRLTTLAKLPAPDPKLPSLGDAQTNLYAGAAAVLLGLILGCVACCSTKSINLAVDCVEVAVNCTFDMPSMLVAPVLQFVSILVLVPSMGGGFVYLLSTGEFTQADHSALASGAISGNAQAALKGAGIQYSTEQYVFIAFAFFMILWIVEFCNALTEFAMAYSVILWYFSPYEDGKKSKIPIGSVFKGYFDAGRYHLGTLACGSFYVAVLGAIGLIASFFERQAKQQGNIVGRIVAACIGCCVYCLKKVLELVNKNAFIDVAMHSNDYCAAASNAITVIVSYGGAVAVLSGTMWALKYAAVGAISGLTGWIMFTHAENSKQSDATSVGIGCAIIAALVALIVMNVLDMVADTILFCFACDKQEEKEEADASCAGRVFGCCGLQSVAEGASSLYHSDATARAFGKLGLKGKGQYVPVELQPLMSKHG